MISPNKQGGLSPIRAPTQNMQTGTATTGFIGGGLHYGSTGIGVGTGTGTGTVLTGTTRDVTGTGTRYSSGTYDPLLQSLAGSSSNTLNTNNTNNDDDEQQEDMITTTTITTTANTNNKTMNHVNNNNNNTNIFSSQHSSRSSSVRFTCESEADPSTIGTATIQSTIISMTKNLLGSGVLSLSGGLASYYNNSATETTTTGSAGSSNDRNNDNTDSESTLGFLLNPYNQVVVVATTWVIVLGLLFGYFCLLIGNVCSMTKSKTYRDCWDQTIGKKRRCGGSGLIVAIVSMLLPAQGNIAYTTVLSQTLQKLLLSFDIVWTRLECILFLTVVVFLPISFMKDLNSLAALSMIGVMSMVIVTMIMILRCVDGSYQVGGIYYDDIEHPDTDTDTDDHNETTVTNLLSWNATFNVLPYVCMVFQAYVMHYNSPRFYMELKHRSIHRYAIVTSGAFLLGSLLSILIGVAGFLTFKEKSQSYILNNCSTKDPLAIVCRISVFLSTLLVYPLAFMGTRDGVLAIFQIPVETSSTKTLNSVSLSVLFLLTVGSVKFHDLGLINAVGGGTLATFLCIIFPALMYRQAVLDKHQFHQNHKDDLEEDDELYDLVLEDNNIHDDNNNNNDYGNQGNKDKNEILQSYFVLFLMIIGTVLGSLGVYASLYM